MVNIYPLSKLGSALVFVVFMTVNGLVFGQQNEHHYTNLQWFQYYNTTEFNEKWYLNSDVGYRFRDFFEERSQYLIRTAVGRKFNDSFKVAAGVANFGFYGNGELKKMEYRGHQEIHFKGNMGNAKLKHRFRLEQRYFEIPASDELDKSHYLLMRYRYMINTSIPLKFLSKTEGYPKVSLSIGDEILLQSQEDLRYNYLSQNRVLIGPVISFNPDLSLNLIYHHQFQLSSSGDDHLTKYIAWIQIKHRIS